jgi:hypothetical protein
MNTSEPTISLDAVERVTMTCQYLLACLGETQSLATRVVRDFCVWECSCPEL